MIEVNVKGIVLSEGSQTQYNFFQKIKLSSREAEVVRAQGGGYE